MVSNANFFNRPTIPPFPADSKEKEIPTPIPQSIGPYHVETLLDKGGMSLLYLGAHPETQIPITIKVLSPKFLSHPEMTSHFLKEAEIIAMADHPNIVKLFGYGEWEGGLYIAMEFIPGVSLRQYLMQSPLSLKRALELVLEIAYALCHLHTHGVIHRDLKPENILVNELGQIKVIDFGIAQLIDPQSAEKQLNESEKGRLIGTPIYMSPEQRENPASVSYPSDIYSLGIIAYELVLGKLSQGQVHIALMPKGFQKILIKMLQPNPADRYLDVVDFISDLSSYLHSPQFERERKLGDQAGELFEKFQLIHQKLIPTEVPHFENVEMGFAIHRPLGASSLFIDARPNLPLLALAESSSLEVDGLLQLLYLKGALEVILPEQPPFEKTAEILNHALLNAPINPPLTFALLSWDQNESLVHFLSCGFGPLWKMSANNVESIPTSNIALGVVSEFSFTERVFPLEPKEQLILCPLSTTGIPFSAEQFAHLLEEFSSLPPQKLADAIYRKAKSLHTHYFDEHPFVVIVLKFLET